MGHTGTIMDLSDFHKGLVKRVAFHFADQLLGSWDGNHLWKEIWTPWCSNGKFVFLSVQHRLR